MNPQPADSASLERLLQDRSVKRLFALLNPQGEETRLNGGAVRNGLLNLPIADMDFATTLQPKAVMALAARAGLRALPTGLAHGTVTLVIEGAPFEVTTLREDLETDGRHALVRFGRDFIADAQRRDFTINALSLSEDGRLHDSVGGLSDLNARRVRFIGDPARRIEEDYLRILRFFRFSAAYGAGPLDQAGLRACIQLQQGVARLSAERLRAELLKCLAAPRAAEVAGIMAEMGLLQSVFGALAYPARLKKGAMLENSFGHASDPLRRLMFLAIRTQEDADDLRRRLRLSNAEHSRLLGAARVAERLYALEAPPGDIILAAHAMESGAQALQDGLILAFLDHRAAPQDGGWRQALHQAAQYANLKLPVSGEDFKKRGMFTGPAIGAALKDLQARWIRAGFPKDPATLARLIDETLAELEKKHCQN